jgi:mono/diheme cytochrome c family protein
MHRMIWGLVGGIVFCMVAAVVGFAFLKTGANGLSARAQPSALEGWLARQARAMAVPASARNAKNPTPDSAQVLTEARDHWADHCALCHANDGSGDTVMGKHMYPPAPDMRKSETQNLSDGELFYIIQNGIRLTGMPGWGGASDHDAEDSWKLVRFIRHLPAVTLEERKEMEKVNPKSPEEIKEEEEEERFLKGETTDEPNEHHHH